MLIYNERIGRMNRGAAEKSMSECAESRSNVLWTKCTGRDVPRILLMVVRLQRWVSDPRDCSIVWCVLLSQPLHQVERRVSNGHRGRLKPLEKRVPLLRHTIYHQPVLAPRFG